MKKANFALALALIMSLALGLAGVSAAQTMVTVDGHVYDDDSGDPISNAHVTAQNQETSQTYDIYTDGSGYYERTIESGNYHVTVTAMGYEVWFNDVTILSDDTNDIYLNSYGDGGGDGGGIDDGGGDSGDFDFDPMSELGQFMWVIYLVAAMLITTFVCIVITSIATTAAFVRLGKVKKGLKEVNEKLDDMEKRQSQQPPSVYQQQPLMQHHMYQQQPGYQEPAPQGGQQPPQQGYNQPPPQQ